MTRSGRRDLALECLRQAVRLGPQVAEARNHLGILLAEESRFREAAASFQKAVGLKPDYAEAHNNLGNVLRELEAPDEAAAHLREALRLRPDFAQAHHNLGIVLAQQGRLVEAVACFQEVLRLRPDYAAAHFNLGDALARQGSLSKAEGHLRAGLRVRPDVAAGHSSLGWVLQEQRQLVAAEASLRQALLLKPDYAEALVKLGQVLREQDRLEEARACFEQALLLKANDAEAHCHLATLLKNMGDLAAAGDSYRAALHQEPGHVDALSGLANLLRGRLHEPELTSLHERLADPRLGDDQRCRLLFALSGVLDARGAYDQAAAHLHEANALARARCQRRGQAYQAAEFSRLVDRLQQTFRRAFFDRVRGWGSTSERPVFIFGLPRSGTTLTEQILASHSQVHGGGELHFAETDFWALAAPAAATGTTAGATLAAVPDQTQVEQVFAASEGLDQPAVQRLARDHLNRLAALDPSRPRVTSKMPDDWLFAGLLATLFPRARFIHCRRDPRDVAVSCWMTYFQVLNWTCDWEHIICRFRDYQRLLTHWRDCLPVPMLEIDYEETVADLEGTARRLVSWLGLEWEDACLNFHQARRPVRTASAAQVRQPIYHTSVGRWRHYAFALGPQLARLSPPV